MLDIMQADQSAQFSILGADQTIYGPVELPTLVNWIKDQRVTAETWVYDLENDRWQKAAKMAELQLFYQKKNNASVEADAKAALETGMLRRVRILADLNEAQLERFVQFMEVQGASAYTQIVKQGEPGDAMYLVLEGELRARLMIDGKETMLATLSAGEFFGEMALFDQGPRSADVLTNKESLLLKISAEAFERLLRAAPDIAAPILFAIAKTMAARIRTDNKRIKDSVSLARAAGW